MLRRGIGFPNKPNAWLMPYWITPHLLHPMINAENLLPYTDHKKMLTQNQLFLQGLQLSRIVYKPRLFSRIIFKISCPINEKSFVSLK